MLEKIIITQKEEFLRKRAEVYVPRLARFKGEQSGLIQVVLGPRRAGKSFYTIHSMNFSKAVGYVNFDDERLSGITDFDAVIEAIKVVYNNPRHLLFDEIQNVANWELIVNRLHRQGYQLFLTGSNSKLLSRELATHLTGRHLSTVIFPFSFAEILQIKSPEHDLMSSRQRCLDYIKRGGFPELWIKHIDFPEYLSSLFNSIIFKDIVKRYKLRDTVTLSNLAFYLLSTMTGEFSYQSLAKRNSFGSVATIRKYVNLLEEAFLLFTVNRFSFKTREQIASNKKIYTYDNGFYQANSGKFTADNGKLFENAVAVELKRRESEGRLRLFYWKNEKHEEVDFVLQEGTSITSLIQVCSDLSNPKVKNREIRSLLKAGNVLNCNNLVVITDDYESRETVEWFGITGNIRFIPLYKFLEKS